MRVQFLLNRQYKKRTQRNALPPRRRLTQAELRQWREGHLFTQESAAYYTGYSLRQYARIENEGPVPLTLSQWVCRELGWPATTTVPEAQASVSELYDELPEQPIEKMDEDDLTDHREIERYLEGPES